MGFLLIEVKQLEIKICRELYNLEWVFEFFVQYVLHKMKWNLKFFFFFNLWKQILNCAWNSMHNSSLFQVDHFFSHVFEINACCVSMQDVWKCTNFVVGEEN